MLLQGLPINMQFEAESALQVAQNAWLLSAASSPYTKQLLPLRIMFGDHLGLVHQQLHAPVHALSATNSPEVTDTNHSMTSEHHVTVPGQ